MDIPYIDEICRKYQHLSGLKIKVSKTKILPLSSRCVRTWTCKVKNHPIANLIFRYLDRKDASLNIAFELSPIDKMYHRGILHMGETSTIIFSPMTPD